MHIITFAASNKSINPKIAFNESFLAINQLMARKFFMKNIFYLKYNNSK